MGVMTYVRENALYFQGVVGGKVIPHTEPSLPLRRQLKSREVGAVDLMFFHLETV